MDVAPEHLAEVSCFQELGPATQRLLAQAAERRSWAVGEILYRQDDPPTGLFAMLAGRVKLYRQSKGRTQILAILLAGECFGAESLADGTPCPWTAEAMEPTTTLCVSPERLRQLLTSCPDLQAMLLERVSSRLRQFAALVHDLAFRDVAARLAAVLLARAEAEGVMTAKGMRVHRTLSQQELAAMVGTAREVVYRTFKRFERDGLVRLTPTDIVILDVERLADIARSETR